MNQIPSHRATLFCQPREQLRLDLLDAMADTGIWLPVVGFGQRLDYDTIIAGTKAGVTDYFIGDFDRAVLLRTLETAYLSGQAVRQSRMRRAKTRLLIAGLSAREREVVDLLGTGFSNKEWHANCRSARAPLKFIA